MFEPSPRTSPLFTGAVLLGAGLLLRQWQPSALTLPERPEISIRDRGMHRAARKARDGIAQILPSNLTASLGRTLIVAGLGLLLVRLLDMAVDDDAALY
ncbi:hypothetical protein LX81_00870 [Palleronia aestuarii]|uniref:Uncharacterized protein n=1 Tax=Palleronia aestuarii TaxID=568105 RepID=A0A2W7NCY3_9RHOB|nr:hypothetical protein [Palleronia aestuarii]PZX18241.1 hypothetical protein LX81_00870 [Palleronia aestuarii]